MGLRSWGSWGALGALGALLGRSWALLGLLGRSWGSIGRSWGSLGALLERPWGALGPSWGALGRSWGALGTLLGRSWGTLGRSWDALGRLLGTTWEKHKKKSLFLPPTWTSKRSQVGAKILPKSTYEKRYDFRDDFSSFLKGLPSILSSRNRSLFDVKWRNP